MAYCSVPNLALTSQGSGYKNTQAWNLVTIAVFRRFRRFFALRGRQYTDGAEI